MDKSRTSSRKTWSFKYFQKNSVLSCKKMRCEIQKCGKYQHCRMFIENTLAVDITMSSVKTQEAIFKSKFVIKQDDKVLRKQQSFGLRLKFFFQNEDIIEEYSALNYRTDFTFKKTHVSSRN